LPAYYSRAAVLAALVVAAFLLAAGVLDQRTTSEAREDSRSVVHTYDVLHTTERILSGLKDAETGQRGYLLTGDSTYLEPYEKSRIEIPNLFEAAERLTKNDALQKQRLRRLKTAADERLAVIGASIKLQRENRADDAIAKVTGGRGKALMDDVRRIAAEMVEAESSELANRERKTEESFRWSIRTSWLTEALGLLGLAAFVMLLFRHMHAASNAAESLYEQRELLRTTFTSIADAVIATDADGRVSSLNAVASALTGWSSEEALGQPLETVFQIINERTRAPAESPARLCLREQRAAGQTIHVVLLSKEGGERPIDMSAAPIRTTAGAVVGAVLVFRDATERKRAEDELRQMAADLSEADRRKDEFLATLAHELRNPLAPIRNSMQILKLARNDDRTAAQAQAVIERQLAQMTRLVDDLLDVTRVKRNKLELRKERVDLWSAVMLAVDSAQPVIDAGGHDLQTTPPEEPIALDADPVRLGQIFVNLLTNAAKYTAPGGRIDVACHRVGSDACVSVRDNGEGISPEMLPLIFDMFMQVDASLERSQGGLGIGLTLVRRLVELHGGSVSVASAGVGEGSEFVVRLPILVDAPLVSAAHGVREIAATSANSCKILVVDDNRDAAQSLAQVLKLLGHEAQVVYDGLTALEIVEMFEPNMILLDLGLPKLNGFETCHRIRCLNLREQPILVAVTGWGQDRDRRRCEEAGFDHYFVKPLDVGRLLALIQRSPCATE